MSVVIIAIISVSVTACNDDRVSNEQVEEEKQVIQEKQVEEKNITKEYVLKRAKEAQNTASSIENNSDKIVSIIRSVDEDIASSEVSNKTVVEILDYVIEKYEINKLRGGKDTLKYMYLTTFLNEQVAKNDNLEFASDVVYNMNTICKDTIRQLDLSMIQANINQVDDAIEQVKEKLDAIE